MSAQSQVTCPKCGDVISIAQAIGAEIEQKLEREFRTKMAALQQEQERKMAAARQEIERKIREDLAARSQVEFADLKAQVEEKNKRLLLAQTQELEMRKKQ